MARPTTSAGRNCGIGNPNAPAAMHVSFVDSGEIVATKTRSQPCRSNSPALETSVASVTPNAERMGRPTLSNPCAPTS